MAIDCDRADEGSWDELEQGFFAAAPPDVPEPAPEPMRFDDLDPVGPARPQSRAAAWRAAAAASAGNAWRKLTPAKASAAAAWRRLAPGVVVVSRRSARHVAAAARLAARVGQAQVPRLLAIFRNSSRQVRLLAAGAAALIAVTGVSAGVVASRGNGRALPVAPHAQSTIASGLIAPPTHPPASLAPPTLPSPAIAMTVAPDEDPLPASASIAPAATAPAPRKRKHTKTPARLAVRAKAGTIPPAGKIPLAGKSPAARPAPSTFSR